MIDESEPYLVFMTAFMARFVAAVITTVSTLNPSSTSDAVKFGLTAASVARGFLKGQPYLYTTGLSETYELWGTFLAPFWLLPGPSGFYARLGNVFLGAFAIYNVYLIARYYHSHHAGVVASLPMVFYPSFVAIQSTLLREAIVLFGVTTAARLLLIHPTELRSRLLRYALAGIVLSVAYIHRTENAAIYAAALGAGLFVFIFERGYLSKQAVGALFALAPVALLISLPIIQHGIQFLSRTRELRAEGRAIYFPNITPQTIPEFLGFSWIGAGYFLYAPLPWMIETIPDLISGIEGVLNLAFTLAAIWGVRVLWRKNTAGTIGLLVGFAVAVTFYGVATANYGAAVRHRQMFIWVIFLFGGIGISEYVKFKWPFERGESAQKA